MAREEYCGDILAIRAVEDAIRNSHMYTKGAFKRNYNHLIQGDDFPSKVVTEHYQVYPGVEVNLDMNFVDAILWLAGKYPCVDVRFNYNYIKGSASVVLPAGNGARRELEKGIPGFKEALSVVVSNEKIN